MQPNAQTIAMTDAQIVVESCPVSPFNPIVTIVLAASLALGLHFFRRGQREIGRFIAQWHETWRGPGG